LHSDCMFKYQLMSLQLITKFREGENGNILKMISELGRDKDVECVNFTGFCSTTEGMPLYVFVTKEEVVIVMFDWRKQPAEELADEEENMGQPPHYFSFKKHRVSPVWQLTVFTHYYKQAMAESNVKLGNVWSVLISNSRFVNYEDMMFDWEMSHVTVYHGFGKNSFPSVYYSRRYHRSLALPHYKAFRQWCERHNEVPRDPYAYEDIDADYDEMEFGLDDDDEDIDDLSLYDDADEDGDDDDIPVAFRGNDSLLLQNAGRKRPLNVEILKPMPAPHQKLEGMVGCQRIKSQIDDLLELTRYNRKMSRCYPDWKQHQVSLHAVFFGRPGTGKTTICKIYGALLKEAGVLSKGHVVVCNRATFMGPNWGDEEYAIHQVLEIAEGGVLMIDEAYLLNSDHPNDPGKLILPQFMDVLADEDQRDVAVVLCGYKEPMQKLLDLNPGLASRFPNRFEFEDFSIDELMKITRRRLAEYGYHFTRAGLQKYRSVLTEAYAVRNPNNWGNARYVANLLEHIYLLHARRCMKSKNPQGLKSFFSITPADIQPIEVPKEKKRIGF